MALPAFRISEKKSELEKQNSMYKINNHRKAELDINPAEFKYIGRQILDQLSDFMQTLSERPVTTSKTPSEIRASLPDTKIPQESNNPLQLLEETVTLLANNSLFNGHPKFMGYITSSPAPIGALAEMIAAVINANVGAWNLAPIATEIEKQTISWIAEMLGYPANSGGVMTSGGNMANFTALIAARKNKTAMQTNNKQKLVIYATKETHTWLEKAADMAGLNSDNINWVPMDMSQKMVPVLLRRKIEQDIVDGHFPFMVVANAGTTSTGIIDPIKEMSDIAKEFDLWLHVDGAYGAFAAMIDDAPKELKNLQLADSVAVDPHKWLYAPLDAGCLLVKDMEDLREAFSYKPSYYKFESVKNEPVESYLDFGPENSRSFRALKVWLAIKQAGLKGYRKMLSDDVALAKELFLQAEALPTLEAFTHNLSITTFRYVPEDLVGKQAYYHEEYLNRLNTLLLTRLQESGKAFVSNAVLNGRYVLRACIVNFHTSLNDIHEMINTINEIGVQVDGELRAKIKFN